MYVRGLTWLSAKSSLSLSSSVTSLQIYTTNCMEHSPFSEADNHLASQ